MFNGVILTLMFLGQHGLGHLPPTTDMRDKTSQAEKKQNTWVSPPKPKFVHIKLDHTVDNTGDEGTPVNVLHRLNCTVGAHPEWHIRGGIYYNFVRSQTCRLPDCMEACSINQGELAYPNQMHELPFFLAAANPLAGPILLGVYLPLELPEETPCERDGCEHYLITAKGEPFAYQKWMGDMFNRVPGQSRCFKIESFSDRIRPEVSPTDCGAQHHAICSSHCPKPGTPIYLPPEDLQNGPLGLETMKIRRNVAIRKHLQEAILNEQEMNLPEIT